jgi:hypothetical protein
MHELHILDAFLRLPHQEIRELSGQIPKSGAFAALNMQ